MSINKKRLYQRIYIEELLSQCENIIKNGKKTQKLIMLTIDEHDAFFELGLALKLILSRPSSQIGSDDISTQFLKMNPTTAKRALFRTDTTNFKIVTLEQIVKNARRVADEEIGTIKDLKYLVDITQQTTEP